jgi:hypothetical protein
LVLQMYSLKWSQTGKKKLLFQKIFFKK